MSTSTTEGPAFTITQVEPRPRTSVVCGAAQGIYAEVTFPTGNRFELSRLDGETDWTVDASWGPGSFPRWVNGYGARYLMTKHVTDPALIAALDVLAAASEADADAATGLVR